jgi:outer membrane protein OmpA-like peptidoglycan-associated protein
MKVVTFRALTSSSKALLIPCLIAMSACEARRPSHREAGALAGGALGAGLGAIVGNQVGSSGEGVAIGAAFGALSGALLGNEMDAASERSAERDERLRRQAEQLEENRRLIEELRSRGVDVTDSDRGVVVNLPDVLFEFDSARLTGRARTIASEIADAIGESGRRVSVEGHTDSVGTVQYNERLSYERARSVADELAAEGVPRRRLDIKGFGESRPVASNASTGGRQRNRRVEVIVENR